MPEPISSSTSTVARALAALAVAILASAALAACGGDDGSDSESDAPATTAEAETQAVAIDAEALEGCLLTSALDRGIYEKVRDPAATVEDAAAAGGADFFELSKADEGLAYYFAYPDAGAAEAELGAIETALADVQTALAEGAPKGISLGDVQLDPVESLVIGTISFDDAQASQLQSDVLADASNCLTEIAGGE